MTDNHRSATRNAAPRSALPARSWGVRGLFAITWCLVGFIGVAGTLCQGGCSSSRGQSWLASLRPKSSKYWLDMALDSEYPDDRRRGVVGLAESSGATAPWAIKVYDTIARTDSDAMVRCAALRALLKVPGEDQVSTALKLLNSGDVRYEDVRKASAPVRWGAATLLLAVVQNNAYREDQHTEIVDVLLARLGREKDNNVRLTLIDALAYFPERPVLIALVGALGDENFAVQHAAEMSLVALTGVTHRCDPDAWRQWLAQADDPFAHAGETPQELQAERDKPRWDWLSW
jgi:hypothetical protein